MSMFPLSDVPTNSVGFYVLRVMTKKYSVLWYVTPVFCCLFYSNFFPGLILETKVEAILHPR
jgi:hypothetical protein